MTASQSLRTEVSSVIAKAAYDQALSTRIAPVSAWPDPCVTLPRCGSKIMAINGDAADRRKQDERIRELKRRAEEINGGPVVSWKSNAMPADLLEEFWRRVVDHESAPFTQRISRSCWTPASSCRNRTRWMMICSPPSCGR